MEAKTVKNLSAALVCIFIFAVMILVGGLTYYYRRGVDNAGRVFSSVMEKVAKIQTPVEEDSGEEVPLENLPQDVAMALNESVDLNSNLAALAIKINGILVYARPMKSSFFVEGPDGLPEIHDNSVILKTYDVPFSVRGTPIAVTALIYVLQPAEIFKSARIAFLMVLAATLAAVILLVYLRIYPVEGMRKPEKPSASPAPPQPPPSPPPVYTPPVYSQPPPPQTLNIVVSPGVSPKKDAEDDEITPIPPLIEESPAPRMKSPVFPERPPAVPISPVPVTVVLSETAKAAPMTSTQPPFIEESGAYSSETGLLKERYLPQGLSAALVEAEKNERDLALLFVAIPGLDRTSATGETVCKALLTQFTPQGKVYEYKLNDFAVVVPGGNFTQGVPLAEQLYLRLTEILSPAYPQPEIGIGITNRLTRVITAARLMAEAEHAVAKALADPENPIVALKINMDKYKQSIGS